MFTQYQSVNTGDVYAAWSQTVNKVLQVFVAASSNNGISFTTTQLSLTTSGGPAEIPTIGAAGSDVYVGWYQPNGCTYASSGACIFVAYSNNNGQSWSAPIFTNPGSGVGEEQIVASGHNAYFTSDGINFVVFLQRRAVLVKRRTSLQLFALPELLSFLLRTRAVDSSRWS